MDLNLKKLLSLAVISKLCVFLVIYLGFNLLPFAVSAYHLNFHYPVDEPISLLSAFKTWDAQHYIFLAENGYRQNPMSFGFFPLFPSLIRTFAPPFFGDFFIVGIILSNIFSLIALVFLYLLVKKLFEEEIAFITGLFMLAFPTAFFLNLIYSESLFLMLVVAAFYFMACKKYEQAAIFAFFLPLARFQGLLIIFPLLVVAVRENFSRGSIFLFLAPAGGFLCYLLFMQLFAGSFYQGFSVQDYCLAKNSLFNCFDLIGWFKRNFINISFQLHGFTNSVIDRLFFVGFLGGLFFIFRRLKSEFFIYSLLLGLIPALSDSFMSYSRFLLLIFPLYIILAVSLKEKHYYLTVPMLVMQVVFLLLHSLNYWLA